MKLNFISVVLLFFTGMYMVGLFLLTGFRTKTKNPEDFLFKWNYLVPPVLCILIALSLNRIPLVTKYLQ